MGTRRQVADRQPPEELNPPYVDSVTRWKTACHDRSKHIRLLPRFLTQVVIRVPTHAFAALDQGRYTGFRRAIRVLSRRDLSASPGYQVRQLSALQNPTLLQLKRQGPLLRHGQFFRVLCHFLAFSLIVGYTDIYTRGLFQTI